jgi:hypothetical protein
MPPLGVVKGFIANGKDLHDCFGQIGQMVNAKEDLKLRQQKNKKSLFASDAEEFMALEQIARAEQELRELMQFTMVVLVCGTTLLCFRLKLARQD